MGAGRWVSPVSSLLAPISSKPVHSRWHRECGQKGDQLPGVPKVSLTAGNTLFVIVSFEGTDPYSQAGGLGVRISGLVDTLASSDYETHLFFIGDPALPSCETR